MSWTNRERKFQGANTPGSEYSWERKFQGTKVPGQFRSGEQKFYRANWPESYWPIRSWERKGRES